MGLRKDIDEIQFVVSDKSRFILFIDKEFIVKGFTANTYKKVHGIFGKTLKIGLSILDLVGSKNRLHLENYMNLVFEGNTLKNDWMGQGVNQEDYWFEVFCDPVYKESSKIIGVCITARSMSDIKSEKNAYFTKVLEDLILAQKQLIQQEKLACIGQLVAGVAHEINNPLGFINSNVETSRMYFSEFKEMMTAYKNFIRLIPSIPLESIEEGIQNLEHLECKKDIPFIADDFEKLSNDIEDGLKRITEIIATLKGFSRLDQNSEFEEYDLNRSIQSVLLITKNDIKYHANVKECLGNIPRIQAMGNKIDQVLLNIIINSSQAIKEKQLKDNQPKKTGLISITTDMKDGFVRCIIEDDGIGVDEKNINKIFDPFFTTKPMGAGTGLGLSIGYDIIVNQHKGQLLVESKPMLGSKFIIMLPVCLQQDKAGEQ